MEKDKKKTMFIRQPEFPGGPKELSKFIYGNVRYPQAAFDANIEGTVYIEYEIDYQGNVVDTRVLQGIGHGCDEEACRVVKMLKFEVGKNRGVKVAFHRKVNIQFKKPLQQPAAPMSVVQVQYNYAVTSAPAPVDKQEEKKAPEGNTYSYTIQL